MLRRSAATLCILLAAFAAQPAHAQTVTVSDVVLILPFENTTSNREANWVGESFADQLAELLGAHGLRVVSSDARELTYQRLRLPLTVIPSRATFTVDLRDPDEGRLRGAEASLARYLDELALAEGVSVSAERLARSAPVSFDGGIVGLVEDAAEPRGLRSRRMTSGAGHDAQMMARVCPAAMIFVPSVGGISHNPREHTPAPDLVAGADVLLDVVRRLAGAEGGP